MFEAGADDREDLGSLRYQCLQPVFWDGDLAGSKGTNDIGVCVYSFVTALSSPSWVIPLWEDLGDFPFLLFKNFR